MQSGRAASGAWFLAVVLAMSPVLASALGLGAITVDSALNQPLQARIALVSAKPGDVEALKVGLADAAMFERAGIVRHGAVLGLRFEVVRAAPGAYVRVSSKDAVREPALEFVLEAAWSGGRALRTYTVLLSAR